MDEDVDEDEDCGEKVQRLQSELDMGVRELQAVDGNASDAVKAHPAFLKMRGMVVEKLHALHDELAEARAAHATQAESGVVAKGGSQADLSEMLREAMAKLWERPYDCRVFTLQLLQALAQLDDASLCMMSSCFSRYLENHSVPA